MLRNNRAINCFVKFKKHDSRGQTDNSVDIPSEQNRSKFILNT